MEDLIFDYKSLGNSQTNKTVPVTLALPPIFRKLFFDNTKTCVGATLLPRAAINQNNVHSL
jgi:hypothetical protein